MNKLFLVDAYALIYRSYYAFLGRKMNNGDGVNTAAIFGFVKYLKDLIKRERPKYLGVAFDPKGGTFRHVMYPLYKANRSAAPEDIHISVPYIKEILDAMHIPILEVAGYEADDVIGTLSARAADQGFEVYMVTPDKDYGQLVQDNVYMYKQRKGGEGVEVIGKSEIKEHYGVDEPKLIIDILALWGDASDNIPGVMGVGEKGAIKLVNQFGTVEDILLNVDKLKGKQKENVEAARQQLPLSKTLATIDLNVPIEFEPDQLLMENCDCNTLREIYKELGFFSFIKEMDADSSNPFSETFHSPVKYCTPTQQLNIEGKTSSPKISFDGQGSLFDEVIVVKKETPINVQGSLFNDDMSVNMSHQLEPIATNMTEENSYETAATTPHIYKVIDTEAALNELVGIFSKCDEFCFDTETTGLNPFNDRIVGISLSIAAHEAYYIPFNNENRSNFSSILKPLFEDENICKIGQNIKFDIMMLKGLGISVLGLKYDTMILHYLLNPESRHNMNYLSRTYLNYNPIEIESLIGKGAKQLTMDMIPVDRVSEYACEDADITLRLKKILWSMVEEAGFTELYLTIEEPLINILVEIEMEGANLDTESLMNLGSKLSVKLATLEATIREITEEPTLNVNSAKQLGEAIFGKMAIDKKPKRTKTKQYRTDEEYLQSLSDKHPIIEYILEYRGIKKLLSTYIEALPALVNKETGRIHTSFNQAVTATGRLSSSQPNLQNIPIRDALGKEIRKCFIARDSDHTLLSVDYSQVELRLMAHLSKDKALLEAFNNGEDIHTATAARLFSVPLNEVTSDQRRKAKTANFGIIYGISAFGLATRLNIPRSEAKEIIEGYFASYQGVKTYMEQVVIDARENGYVTTIFGRKRFLEDINSGNAVVRSLAERNAINAPIQGSAADIMKIAMIKVSNALRENNLKSKVIIQVHDELLVDMLNSEKEEVINIIQQCMEGAASLHVNLLTDYGVADNWLDAH